MITPVMEAIIERLDVIADRAYALGLELVPDTDTCLFALWDEYGITADELTLDELEPLLDELVADWPDDPWAEVTA